MKMKKGLGTAGLEMVSIIVAIVLGVAILGESVEPIALAGVLVVMAGAWIASRRES